MTKTKANKEHYLVHLEKKKELLLELLTKNNEACVCVSGAQRILGRATVHGAIEFCRHSLQHKFLPISLGTAVQQSAAHPRPGEQRLRKHLILEVVCVNVFSTQECVH